MESQSNSPTTEPTGSGIDPDFKDFSAQLHPHLIGDWLSVLKQENTERIERAADMDGFAMKPRVVEYVFTVSLRLRLPREVKFIALAILEKFMTNHVRGLYSMIQELDKPDDYKLKNWEKIEANISRQLPLRVVSALQLASKLHSYHESLSTKQARICLRNMGHAYTDDSIRKSEVRMLVESEYCANARTNPTNYLEGFFKELRSRKTNFAFNDRETWNLALLFLDCAFLKIDEFFREIVHVLHGDNAPIIPNATERMKAFFADYALLAIGCLLSAFMAVHGEEVTRTELMPPLLEISAIPEDDACTVTLALTNMVANAANRRASQSKNHPGPDLAQGAEFTSAQF